jgi:regulator of sigma E protease
MGVQWYYFLAAIPVFGLLVLVHEFGHFITAKWAGIKVEEFGIGFPPRLFGIKRGETIYSLNWLPIGGFVRMLGENGETAEQVEQQANQNSSLASVFGVGGLQAGVPTGDSTSQAVAAAPVYDPRSFAAKPPSKRLTVLLAGVVMNVLMAFVLLTAAEVIGQPDPARIPPVVGEVVAGSPAAQAGLKTGDRFLTINGQTVTYYPDFRAQVAKLTDDAPKDVTTVPITVTVQRPGVADPVTLTVLAIAHPDANQGHFGFSVDESGTPYIRVPLWQAPAKALQDMGDMIVGTVNGIGQIIHGQIPWNKAVSGPVGIVNVTGQVAATVPQIGPYLILYLTAYLSLNLAFVNALPIPALDGGRVLLVLVEVLRRGKRLSAEREGLINLVGMGLLLLLMLIVTLNDVGNLFPR